MSQTIIIIGAGLAGATAAITLREEGFAGKVMLIGAESHAPYERPPLSKKYLQGEKLLEEIKFRPISFYAERNIETRFGVTARRVDPGKKVVELENGNLDQRNFVGFYLQDQRISAAVAINRPKELRLTMSLIQVGVQVEAENLVDESVKLRSLIPRG